jgi:undecaprenyl-diphosphatase
VIVVTVVLLAQRCFGGAVLWLLMTNGGNQVFSGLKRLTSIERPQWVAEPPASLSFPSGHASMALVFAGTLCVLAWPPTGRRVQRLMLWAAASYAFLQATSRTYLGVHWAADIGAGLLLGGALLAMAAVLNARFPFKTARPASLVAATLIAWAIALLVVILPSLSESLLRYSPVN